MAKKRSVYICQECGHQEFKWMGRCPSCEAWSTLVEEIVEKEAPAAKRSRPKGSVTSLNDIVITQDARISSGITELDRVLGGGVVSGALILIGGDPGIGKSTLVLQALGNLASTGHRVLYVTAEESLTQIKMRADRLDIHEDDLFLLAETQIEDVQKAIREISPDVLVIDSIQTVGLASVESSVGSVSQIRAVTHALMAIAKDKGITTFVVGHVTKDGAIAGPRVMEHMVDTVLYFEGERSGPYRILRAHKNRFGSAMEIGVFEMHADGLRTVENPSEV
ncbi:AAA family ATPase, partial [Myxococcota bacterium]|nr:AAA family ATPase [Myxococcota bacterium]